MIQTPLEARGYGAPIYTTAAEEAAFLAALAADSPRVAVEQIGVGAVDNTPIWLVTIGEPGPVDPGDTDSMLVVAYQHGGEYATREAAIKFVRDLAYTTDAALVAYLAAHPVYVIVSANPDRISDWPRENKNGVDLNRDHLALSQPETHAINEAINRIAPTLVIDVHENDVLEGDIQYGKQIQPWAAQELVDASGALHAAIESYAISQGLDPRPHGNVPEPSTLGSALACRHIPFAIIEAHHYMFDVPTRIGHIITSLRGAIGHHAANASAIRAATAAARASKIAEAEAANVPFHLGPTGLLFPPPVGYWLTAAQYDRAEGHLSAFGATATPDGDRWWVPMTQAAQPCLPLLLDPASSWAVVRAERVSHSPNVVPETWGPVRIGTQTCPVTEVALYDGTSLHAVWP